MITCIVIDHDSIIECLTNKGVVVLPTDTVYGLATLPWCDTSTQRIFELKARPANMNLQILVSWVEDIVSLGLYINTTAKKLIDSPYVPWAITLILGFDKSKPRAPWLQWRIEAWVRIPNNPYLLEIIKKTWPILATSANHHGKPTPDNITDIINQLHGQPDLVVDGWTVKTIPSTIVNCNCEWWKIEREWVISSEELWLYLSS